MSAPIVMIAAAELEAMENELKRLREARYRTELNEEMLRAAKAEEREACAQICDDDAKTWDRTTGATEARWHTAQLLAAAIRARGN